MCIKHTAQTIYTGNVYLGVRNLFVRNDHSFIFGNILYIEKIITQKRGWGKQIVISSILFIIAMYSFHECLALWRWKIHISTGERSVKMWGKQESLLSFHSCGTNLAVFCWRHVCWTWITFILIAIDNMVRLQSFSPCGFAVLRGVGFWSLCQSTLLASYHLCWVESGLLGDTGFLIAEL